jgi:hypothetical protein
MRIAQQYESDDRGFESWQGLGIFLFTTVSRPVLRTTQSPIQWVPGALSLGVKQPEREADHSPQSDVQVKNVWSYTSTLQYVFMAWLKHITFICEQLGKPFKSDTDTYLSATNIVCHGGTE